MMARSALFLALATPAFADDDFLSTDCIPPQCACNAAGQAGPTAGMTRDEDTETERKLDEAAARRKAKKDCFRMAYDQEKEQNWQEYLEKRQGLKERRDNHMLAAVQKELRARHWTGMENHESVVRQDRIFDLNMTVKARHIYKQDVTDADRAAADAYDAAVDKARTEYAARLTDLAHQAGTNSQGSPTIRTIIADELRAVQDGRGDHTVAVTALAGVLTVVAALIASHPRRQVAPSEAPKYGTL